MIRTLLLLTIAFCVATAAERYIITYDNDVWPTALRWSQQSSNTVEILHALKMVIADLPEDEVALYAALPGTTIEKDSPVYLYDTRLSGVQKDPPSWGIDRIDQRNLPLDKQYKYASTGKDVNVYVVDTGVRADHQEFEGRATFAKNFAGDGRDTDCNGHGTHVSSTIGGKTVGVAKEVKIFGVKVLTCSGSGTMAGVVGGINYVVTEHLKSLNKKTVINMSLGGGKSPALNTAVDAAEHAGVTNVVAAGNSGDDACSYSPASSKGAIAIAASDSSDSNAYFSNYGRCVALYAPGVKITGAWIDSDDAYKTIDGTSMASPHVAGVAALLLGSGAAGTPTQVRDQLISTATKDVIKSIPADTPNLLLWSNPGDQIFF